MKRVGKFFINLIKSETAESSKRFIAIFSMIIVAIIVLKNTNSENLHWVLGDLLFFILTILGMAVWQRVKLNKKAE